MFKYLIISISLFISFNVNSNENLLTIQQQLERLQREVSDLSQTVFSDTNNTISNSDNDVITNFSAIDMRIYDLEKDVKNLTGNIENLSFQIDDLNLIINDLKNTITLLEENVINFKNTNINSESDNVIIENKTEEINTLGSLTITSNSEKKDETKNEISENENIENANTKVKMSPEDQFQASFDNIRSKNWDEAKKSLRKFIEDYPENQLSGSAHYWLGELFILENQFRDAALIFAEGYQKFPESIKAPDMLFKLAQSLSEVNKIDDACKTLEKLILDYPKNKFIKSSKKQLQDLKCLDGLE